jgi:hypothetical protein
MLARDLGHRSPQLLDVGELVVAGVGEFGAGDIIVAGLTDVGVGHGPATSSREQ